MKTRRTQTGCRYIVTNEIVIYPCFRGTVSVAMTRFVDYDTIRRLIMVVPSFTPVRIVNKTEPYWRSVIVFEQVNMCSSTRVRNSCPQTNDQNFVRVQRPVTGLFRARRRHRNKTLKKLTDHRKNTVRLRPYVIVEPASRRDKYEKRLYCCGDCTFRSCNTHVFRGTY